MPTFSGLKLTLALVFCGAGVLMLPAVGSAHSRLTSPAPRSMSDALTVGPCGLVPRGTAATDYTPGQTITVEWLQTIAHPAGSYTINFSAADDANFVPLAANITDTDIGTYSQSVTLPPTPTGTGTLQLAYASGGGPYYSCANIRIVAVGTNPQPQPTSPQPTSPQPTSPQPSGSPPPGSDSTAPKMAIPKVATRKMGATRLSGLLSFPVQCNEGCTAGAELRVTGAVARKLGIPTTKKTVLVGSAAASTFVANAASTMKVRLTKRLRTAMEEAATFAATLTTTVTDAAGNKSTSTTRVTLRK